MSLDTWARTMGCVVCLGQLVAGCGQDTPDHLDFDLPTAKFDISSGSLQWRQVPASVQIPNMVCAGPEMLSPDCCSPPAPMAAVDCQQYPVACDPATNFCALTFDMEVGTDVNLATDVAAVAAGDGRVFTQAYLLTVTTSASNLQSLPIRSAELFIGPGDAGGPSSPTAVRFAPVSLAASPTRVVPSAEAQQAFSGFARDYRTPFSLWLTAHLVVPNGSTPSGTVTFQMEARAAAVY